jgi:hypothetical protein
MNYLNSLAAGLDYRTFVAVNLAPQSAVQVAPGPWIVYLLVADWIASFLHVL